MITLVNESDEVIGEGELKDVHRAGKLHRAIHILLQDQEGNIFCRQRAISKTLYPGWWSTSVGAHVESGESYEECARRMLQDMLGIEAALRPLGKIRIHDETENEICMVFSAISEEKLAYNLRHIEGGRFLSHDEVEALTKEKTTTPHLGEALKLLR